MNFNFPSNITTKFILLFSILAEVPVLAQQDEYIPDLTYEMLDSRVDSIENIIPLTFNQKVKDYIDYFSIKNREYTKGVLSNANRYFQIFEPIISKYQLPDELKYLSIVESGLRPQAVSRANATGHWQFIESTGKRFGLRSDWYIDERMDSYKSTEAACKYLKELYQMFDDWGLALAAYNSGPGNVRKAMRRSGGKTFWKIYRYLPRETRSYLPQFVALTYIMNFHEDHNLFPFNENYLPRHDTININHYFHLETFANIVGVCLDDILSLNTSIKRGAVPDGRSFALRIPEELKKMVEKERTMIYDSASKVGKEQLNYLARYTVGSTFGRQKITYKVRSGDVLGILADRYHVRVSDIKKWNGLKSNMIRIGQRLSIWVLPTYSVKTKKLYLGKGSNATILKNQYKVENLYTVRDGDTLWDISREVNQPISKIKEWNQLSSNMIKPGQQLVIKI